MTRFPQTQSLTLVVGLLLAASPPSEAVAADREHQQLMADLRMLQAQTQQLQVALMSLTETLTLVTGRLDEQSDSARRAFADQRLLIDTLSGDVRVVREKLDETGVRISSLSQEVDAMRTSMNALQFGALQLAPRAPDGAPPDELGATQPDPAAPVPVLAAVADSAAPAPLSTFGLSPQRMYDSAYADFASGQWSLAILGFEQYIKAFPTTEQADDAQLYIGESHYLDGKFELAIAAYDKVIADYPTGDAAAMAYFKRGLPLARLGETDRARETWQAVIQKYPDSDASRLASQSLERLDRPN